MLSAALVLALFVVAALRAAHVSGTHVPSNALDLLQSPLAVGVVNVCVFFYTVL